MTELFLGEHIPDEITEFAKYVGPKPDKTLKEMERFAEKNGFPIIGPQVGAWLTQIVRMKGASRVFEFGSGFGYSAYWFSRGLPEDGKIVLTEIDKEELDLAKEFLKKGNYNKIAKFELGEAIEIFKKYDESFDVVLLDIEKFKYVEAFKQIKGKLRTGGVIMADNTMSAGNNEKDDVVDFKALRKTFENPDINIEDVKMRDSAKKGTKGIIDYLTQIKKDPDFETTLLPLGDGVSVTTKTRK